MRASLVFCSIIWTFALYGYCVLYVLFSFLPALGRCTLFIILIPATYCSFSLCSHSIITLHAHSRLATRLHLRFFHIYTTLPQLRDIYPVVTVTYSYKLYVPYGSRKFSMASF